MSKREKIYNLRRGREELNEYITCEFGDDAGHAVIHVQLYEGLRLYDPLSMGRQLELNPEIIDYIDRRAEIIPTKTPLRVCFHGRALSERDQKRVRAILREHYTVVLRDKSWDRRINFRKIVALASFGLLVLFFYLTMGASGRTDMLLEVLSIIASFSLWEAVDLFLVERLEIGVGFWEATQLLEMEVAFVDPADEEKAG